MVLVVIHRSPLLLQQIDGEDAEFTYKLFSVIIHKGGCYGGHYHAFIRDIDQLGKWEPPVRGPEQISQVQLSFGLIFGLDVL